MTSELLPINDTFKLGDVVYQVVKNKTNSCSSCDLRNSSCISLSFFGSIPVCDRRKINGTFVAFRLKK